MKWRILLAVLLTLALVVVPLTSALALTTATVTITGTPTYVAISIDDADWAIGTVATTTDYWWNGSEPGFPLADGNCTVQRDWFR